MPESWNETRVTLLHKGGCKSKKELKNYRPIAVADHFGIAGICCTPNSPGCTPNLPRCTPNLPRCTPKLIERYNLINESALLS